MHSVEQALKLANGPHVCVIGGTEIFKLFLPLADRIELTEIHASPEGDTLMASFDKSEWQEVGRNAFATDGKVPAHDFVTLVRRA